LDVEIMIVKHDRRSQQIYSAKLSSRLSECFRRATFLKTRWLPHKRRWLAHEAVLDRKACPSLTAEDLGNLQSALYAKV
jgi:hypothetical protein